MWRVFFLLAWVIGDVAFLLLNLSDHFFLGGGLEVVAGATEEQLYVCVCVCV